MDDAPLPFREFAAAGTPPHVAAATNPHACERPQRKEAVRSWRKGEKLTGENKASAHLTPPASSSACLKRCDTVLRPRWRRRQLSWAGARLRAWRFKGHRSAKGEGCAPLYLSPKRFSQKSRMLDGICLDLACNRASSCCSAKLFCIVDPSKSGYRESLHFHHTNEPDVSTDPWLL